MPSLPTLVVAWAAVYAYVGVYYAMLYSRQRADREYLAFALLAGALSLYAVGAALLDGADTPQDVAFALRVKAVGVLPAVAFAVDFSVRLRRIRRSWVLPVAYVWAASGLAATIIGLLVTPPEAPGGVGLSPVGLGYAVTGWAFTLHAFAALIRHARVDRHLRLVVASSAVNLLAGASDVAVAVLGLDLPYLLEHTAMLSMATMSWVLLDRFVRTADLLDDRRGELRRSYEELRERQRELVRKQQLAAVGELAAVIAHEVRNPLAIIKNAASGLRRAKLSDDDRSTLTAILDEETQRLRRLSADLLAYTEPIEPAAEAVSVNDLVETAIQRAVEGLGGADGVETKVTVGRGVALRGDAGLLEQALCHVVENAILAMPDGGVIDVHVVADELDGDDAVRITVEDRGVGMGREVAAKARDPFFTTRPSGTGLGLAIVERVVSTHGGRVEIASTTGRGTKVKLLLRTSPPEHDPSTGLSFLTDAGTT